MSDDFYAAGMRATPNYFGGSSKSSNEKKTEEIGYNDGEIVGDIFYTPGQVKDRIISLAQKMTAFAKDVNRSNAPADWSNAWKDFYDGFFKWSANHDSFVSRLPLSGTIDKAMEYEREFEKWKTEFLREHNGKISSAAAVTQTSPSESPKTKKSGWSIGEIVLGGVAIAAAGYAGYTFAKSTLGNTSNRLGFKLGR